MISPYIYRFLMRGLFVLLAAIIFNALIVLAIKPELLSGFIQ